MHFITKTVHFIRMESESPEASVFAMSLLSETDLPRHLKEPVGSYLKKKALEI